MSDALPISAHFSTIVAAMRMRLLIILVGVFLSALPARAAELLMFEQRACPFCEKFNAEIAPDYARSRVGQIAPLRHVDIFESRTGGVDGLDPAVFTPTFVLIDGGREVGRLLGYPGKRYFYPEIQALFDKLPAVAVEAK